MKTIGELLPILEAALAGKEWIAGGLSLADFGLASTFMYRAPARLGVEGFANVTAWIERMEARKSWTEAVLPVLEMMRARGAAL